MLRSELAHLELLAEVDALMRELEGWAAHAPRWPAAAQCEALVKLLASRADTFRVRLDAPLVVATLGGTGTGKSSLVNALVGEMVSPAGRQRPTTRQSILVCRPGIAPQMLGIEPVAVQCIERDLPALRDLVLLDCPDPDTTEDAEAPASNLAQLHTMLPHCDVLLVTSTQQKYRSACVRAELAAASPGTRLVFVQTHADVDDDIREDWRRLLGEEYETGEIFFVDSLAALADAQNGIAYRGEFGRLVELLTRELAGAAANRIRRANFLDLLEQLLDSCAAKIDAELPAVDALKQAIAKHRELWSAKIAGELRGQLATSERHWESRLLAEVASHWGFSPFSLVLRAYQGLGAIISGAALTRVRTPAQLALWGAWEGVRQWRSGQRSRRARRDLARSVQSAGDEAELRTAALVVDGYAADAGLGQREPQSHVLGREAALAREQFLARSSVELQSILSRLAARHSGGWKRWIYEASLTLLLVLLAYRFLRNFFFDSWLAPELGWSAQAQPLLGFDFFLGAGACLVLWCAVLLWAFMARLRRGLTAEIAALGERLAGAAHAGALFANLEQRAAAVLQWRADLERLRGHTRALRERLAGGPRLGHRTTLGSNVADNSGAAQTADIPVSSSDAARL